MKAASFEYHAPQSLEEAAGLLDELGEGAKVLAGGQSLVPMLALRLTRFDDLIDLNRVPELQGIAVSDGYCSIGAMTRQAAVGTSGEVADAVPLLSRAIPLIGHFQIRNRGTIGGSIAHADPASELPAVALALGAELEARSVSRSRRIAASDFFTSMWETALDPDEVLAAIHFPVRQEHSGFAIEELTWRVGDFAIAGAAVALRLGDDARVADAAIALMGVGSTPLLATEAGRTLVGLAPSEVDVAAVGALAEGATNPSDDLHAPASYRRRVTRSIVAKAVGRALEEASNG